MDIASAIVTPVVEALLVPVKRHLGFLVSSTGNVKDMREKVKVLDAAEKDMRTQQELRKGDRRVVPHRVPDWLAEVQSIKERAGKLPAGRVGCFNLKTRYKVGRESSDILKDIDRLMNEKVKMVWTNDKIPLGAVSPPRPTISRVVREDDQNKSMIPSRDVMLKKALESLESNNLETKKMALCGMAGIGKTTMMNEMEKAAKDRKMFDLIVKVAVGQNPNLELVQQTVAEQTGETLIQTTNDTRSLHLKERFKVKSEEGKKKTLVILDDVWDFFNLQDIGLTNPLPNGFKLLLTTREESTCANMDIEASSIFKIDVLKDPEDKKLFWETVGTVSDTETDLRNIGEDIVKRCGGLPIAIKTIASTLKNINAKHSWEDALIRIKNQDFSHFCIQERGKLVLTNIFEFSYQNLKEDDHKATFLLCGLFPEDYDIDIEDLVVYGWGLKFFKNIHDIASARLRVHTYVDDLIRSNLLIESDYGRCVKMHDLVRDFVLSSFSKVKQASIVSDNNNVSEKLEEGECYERILLNCADLSEFPADFSHPNLTLLMLMDGKQTLKFPKDFYTSMEKLMVVAYTNMHQPLLPQFLNNLRALSLFSCSLADDDISLLGGLLNLEVLSLVNCGIKKLPSEIGRLKRLKLLDLTGCDNLSIDDGVFQNLEKLRELYMRVSRGSTIKLTEANCDELYVLTTKLSALEFEFFFNKAKPIYVSFENLEKFRISVGCSFEGKSILKNTLKLVGSCSELVECEINKLFSKTEVLHLAVNDMSYLEDILMHPPPQSSFSNLTECYISDCTRLTYLFTIPVAKSLMKLERLHISDCPVLKSVVHGENIEHEVITFHNLKVMYLDNLPELVSLCDPINIVMELRELTELTLKELPCITSIFNKKIVTPKLDYLRIRRMESLKEVWPCEITGSDEEADYISMLTKIEVEHCPSLVNLFPSNPMRLLSHLEELRVKVCDSIEVLFNIDLGKIEQLSNNVTLREIIVEKCDNFREVWRIKNYENDHSSFHIRSFQAVEHIDICWCGRFKNIVTPATTYFDLRALKKIKINGSREYGERDSEMVETSQKKEINSKSKEEISKVGDDDDIYKTAFPYSSHITYGFHQLLNIEFYKTQGVEVVFEIATQPPPLVLLPCLEYLKLVNMDNLIHVWKCNNWKEFFILQKHQPQSSFQNLTTIYMSECKSIKYLFPSIMVKLLTNLKEVTIRECKCIEEVFDNVDDEDEDMMTSTYLFPHFQVLNLIHLDNLKHIGGGIAKVITHGQSKFHQLDVFLWQNSNKIKIKECHALSSVIPCYAAEQMQNLQEMSIEECHTMKEIFETKEIIHNNISGCSSSTKVSIPRPTNITTHKLLNLKLLTIHKCDCLENIFTLSTLKSLKKLEMLKISYCKAMKVIVKEEAREDTMEISQPMMVLPQLKSVKLDSLPNLEGFFVGVNIDFQWPLLEHVMINGCPQMSVFTASRSTAPRLNYIQSKLGKYNIEGLNFYVTPMLRQTPSLHGISSHPTISEKRTWSLYNLIECNSYYNEHTKIFKSNELQQLQNLETIQIKEPDYGDSNVEEVFEVALEATNNESQTVVNIPKLREVYLYGLNSLKYIWKNNHTRILEFPNLTTLSIDYCNNLEHVFTCSMVSCVMQLQELHIQCCSRMKAIVKEEKEEEEEEEEAKVSEIVFPCLKSLKLEYLWRLEGFCLGKADFKLPSLNTLVIMGCSDIKVFTAGRSITPQLKTLETSHGPFNVGENINSFIMEKKQEGFNFLS